MAAILCKSISDLCRACGDVICLPCKACGIGCDALMKAICGPFFPYIATTVCLNLPPIIYGIKAAGEAGGEGGCMKGLEWLAINAILSLSHLVGALYIVYKIKDDRPSNDVTAEADFQMVNAETGVAPTPGKSDTKVDSSGTTTTTTTTIYPAAPVVQPLWSGQRGDAAPNSMGRVRDILCHDCGVAIYILVFVGWMLWQTMGISRYLGLAGNGAVACDATEKGMLVSLSCGWLYMSLVAVTFCCSFLCLRG